VNLLLLGRSLNLGKIHSAVLGLNLKVNDFGSTLLGTSMITGGPGNQVLELPPEILLSNMAEESFCANEFVQVKKRKVIAVILVIL